MSGGGVWLVVGMWRGDALEVSWGEALVQPSRPLGVGEVRPRTVVAPPAPPLQPVSTVRARHGHVYPLGDRSFRPRTSMRPHGQPYYTRRRLNSVVPSAPPRHFVPARWPLAGLAWRARHMFLGNARGAAEAIAAAGGSGRSRIRCSVLPMAMGSSCIGRSLSFVGAWKDFTPRMAAAAYSACSATARAISASRLPFARAATWA